MLSRFRFRLSLSVAVLGLIVCSLFASAQQESSKRGRKYKPLPPTARIEVLVVRDANGKPIENAAVIFHLVGDKGNMELKTNDDGKAMIDVLPMGSKIRLQVIVRGFQTYGEDYALDQPQLSFEIRMKRPGELYSIYKPHGSADAPKTDAAPPASGEPK